MDITGWILAGALAAFFTFAGISKLVTPRAKLLEDPRMAWANDFTATQIKTIAAIEVIGAVGVASVVGRHRARAQSHRCTRPRSFGQL